MALELAWNDPTQTVQLSGDGPPSPDFGGFYATEPTVDALPGNRALITWLFTVPEMPYDGQSGYLGYQLRGRVVWHDSEGAHAGPEAVIYEWMDDPLHDDSPWANWEQRSSARVADDKVVFTTSWYNTYDDTGEEEFRDILVMVKVVDDAIEVVQTDVYTVGPRARGTRGSPNLGSVTRISDGKFLWLENRQPGEHYEFNAHVVDVSNDTFNVGPATPMPYSYSPETGYDDFSFVVVTPWVSPTGTFGCVMYWNTTAYPFTIDGDVITVTEFDLSSTYSGEYGFPENNRIATISDNRFALATNETSLGGWFDMAIFETDGTSVTWIQSGVDFGSENTGWMASGARWSPCAGLPDGKLCAINSTYNTVLNDGYDDWLFTLVYDYFGENLRIKQDRAAYPSWYEPYGIDVTATAIDATETGVWVATSHGMFEGDSWAYMVHATYFDLMPKPEGRPLGQRTTFRRPS